MSNLTDEQIRGVFDLFDADGSGFIEGEELSQIMEALGFGVLNKDEIDSIVQDIGTDNRIEYAEFYRMCKGRMSLKDSPEEFVKAFRLFDVDNKGKVVVEDMLRVARELGELPSEPGADEKQEAHFRTLFNEIVAEANSENIGGDASGITMPQWSKMQREATADKHHRIDESSYNIQTRAKVAKRSPFGIKVEAGKTYMWCSCGMAKTQPICDGACEQFNRDHGANFMPVKYVADQTRTVWMCGCKQTKAPPLCDGTHTTL